MCNILVFNKKNRTFAARNKSVTKNYKSMKNKQLRMKLTAKAVLIGLLFGAVGMVKGVASNDKVNTNYSIYPASDGDYLGSGGCYYYHWYSCDYTGPGPDGHSGYCCPDVHSASEGQIVTLYAQPMEHCQVASWSVVKRGYENVSVEVTPSLEDPNVATFVMPAFDVDFSVTFEGEENYHIIFNYPCYEHGEVEEVPQVARENEEVTIHIKHIDPGYCLTFLKVRIEPTWESVDIYYKEGSQNIPIEIDIYNNSVIPFHDGDITFTMPNADVSISYEFSEYPYVYYTLVTDVDELVPGKHYIIVGKDESDWNRYYYMNEQGESNRNIFQTFCMSEDGITNIRPWGIGEYDVLFPHYEFVLSGSASEKWTFYDEKEGSKGYLYAASSAENQLKTSAELTDNAKWDIAIASDGKATIVANGENTHNIIRFHPNGYNDGSFSCYASSNEQNPVYIYKKMALDSDYDYYSNSTIETLSLGENRWYNFGLEEPYQKCMIHAPATLTVTETIANNTQENKEYWNVVSQSSVQWSRPVTENLVIEDGAQLIANNGVSGTVKKTIAGHEVADLSGWKFIASPISTSLTPSGLITDDLSNTATNGTATYDLYYYNEAGHQWKNYRTSAFNMNNGQGYLYASKNGTTINFAGTLRASNEAYTSSVLSYTSGNGKLAEIGRAHV